MKLATENEWLFKNYEYTEVMTIKNSKKIKGLGLHLCLSEFLKEYGVYMTGATWLVDENGHQCGDEQVNAVSIKIGEFPLENELVLQQCYGWSNRSVHIFFSGENTSGDFLYNLDDYSVIYDGKKFNSFAEFWSNIKEETKQVLVDNHYLTI